MLDVKIENIVPITEARDNFNKIIDTVEASDELYVLTKNGKPSAVIVGVHHLEKLTGTSHEELISPSNNLEDPRMDDLQTNPTNTGTDTTVAPVAGITPAPAGNVGSDDDASVNEPMPLNDAPATPAEAPAEEPPVAPESPVAPAGGAFEMPDLSNTAAAPVSPAPTATPDTQAPVQDANPSADQDQAQL